MTLENCKRLLKHFTEIEDERGIEEMKKRIILKSPNIPKEEKIKKSK